MDRETFFVGFFCGTLAGALFGSMMSATPMMANIGALLGEGVNVGWGLHLVFSAIFGVIYGIIVSINVFSRFGSSVVSGTILAAVYGIALWLIGSTLVMPLVLEGAVVFDIDGMSFLGHLIYGGLLGAGFATALHASAPMFPSNAGN